MKEIKLSRQTRFLGRNGAFNCAGFIFSEFYAKDVTVSPINSKGDIGNCSICIPKEDLRKFCAHLQPDLVSLVLKNIPPDCLPTLLGLDPELDAIIAKELK